MSDDNLVAGFYFLFLSFLKEKGQIIDVTPYAAAGLLQKVIKIIIVPIDWWNQKSKIKTNCLNYEIFYKLMLFNQPSHQKINYEFAKKACEII